MNAGPTRIPQGHTTLDYCRELRVPIEVFVNANPEAYVYRERAADATGPLTGRPVRRRAAKADLNGYVSELLAKAVDQGALDKELDAADREAMLSYLRSTGALLAQRHLRRVGQPGLRRGPDRRQRCRDARPAVRPRSPCSRPVSDRRSRSSRSGTRRCRCSSPSAGWTSFPHALADAIRGPIRYGAKVTPHRGRRRRRERRLHRRSGTAKTTRRGVRRVHRPAHGAG